MSWHGAEARMRAILYTACARASQGLSMALTVLSHVGFLVQRRGPGARHSFAMKYMGGPNWQGLERETWAIHQRMWKGSEGGNGTGWVHIFLVSSEALPSTADRHKRFGKFCSLPLSSLTCAWDLAETFLYQHLSTVKAVAFP